MQSVVSLDEPLYLICLTPKGDWELGWSVSVSPSQTQDSEQVVSDAFIPSLWGGDCNSALLYSSAVTGWWHQRGHIQGGQPFKLICKLICLKHTVRRHLSVFKVLPMHFSLSKPPPEYLWQYSKQISPNKMHSFVHLLLNLCKILHYK